MQDAFPVTTQNRSANEAKASTQRCNGSLKVELKLHSGHVPEMKCLFMVQFPSVGSLLSHG